MYFPYQKGRYEVSPGLLPLSKDFGNGAWDQKLMQIGDDFSVYRKQFEENRAKEDPAKYVCLSETSEPKALGTISAFIAKKLAEEYPEQISYLENANSSGGRFSSQFTGEVFEISSTNNSVEVLTGKVTYFNAWDAMGAQFPEDIAIWRLKDDGSEEMEALHLNAPNHWAADSKVGKSFAEVHRPVAHMEKIIPWAVSLLQGILDKGPYVRFAWGVGTDNRLNHHPVPPPNVGASEWVGRRFDPANPKLYARVERQVLWNFPELKRALFTIRTYFQDAEELKKTNPEAVNGLIEALLSMSSESLAYKGLDNRDQVISWLKAP